MSYLYPDRLLNDPKRWFDRANEMRALAGEINDISIITVLLKLANDFDMLAERVGEIPKFPGTSDQL